MSGLNRSTNKTCSLTLPRCETTPAISALNRLILFWTTCLLDGMILATSRTASGQFFRILSINFPRRCGCARRVNGRVQIVGWCQRAVERRWAAMEAILTLGRRYHQWYSHCDLRCNHLGNSQVTSSRHRLPCFQTISPGDRADSYFHVYILPEPTVIESAPRVNLLGYPYDRATRTSQR